MLNQGFKKKDCSIIIELLLSTINTTVFIIVICHVEYLNLQSAYSY